MNTLRGSRSTEPNDTKTVKESRPFIVSVVVHAIVIAALVRFLISPAAFTLIFGRAKSAEIPAERIGFLQLPKSKGPAVAGRSGGDNKPVSKTLPKKLVAPSVVPSTIPPIAAPKVQEEPEGGSGPLVGSGGPARGIRPTYSDPRVWVAPGEIVAAPKSAKEKLDSAIVSIIAPYNDSIAAAAGGRQPGDWTIDRNGKKWGVDPKYIHLGKFSIPTAVLALLPMNMTGNPTMMDRNKLQNQLHSDIFWNAQRGMNEADFRKAVKSIRERKEREKEDAEKKARPTDGSAAQSPPVKN
jgi:hypothetical protein